MIKLTDKKIKEFLKESNAIEDVFDDKSLGDALRAWRWLSKQKKLTIKVICETHRLLMRHQPLADREKGEFRRVPVWVGGKEQGSPAMLGYKMSVWVDLADRKLDWDGIKRLHVIFEQIHPFCDGNGRTGRLLMLWQFKRNRVPVRIIYEKKKSDYYKWFEKTLTFTPKWERWDD